MTKASRQNYNLIAFILLLSSPASSLTITLSSSGAIDPDVAVTIRNRMFCDFHATDFTPTCWRCLSYWSLVLRLSFFLSSFLFWSGVANTYPYLRNNVRNRPRKLLHVERARESLTHVGSRDWIPTLYRHDCHIRPKCIISSFAFFQRRHIECVLRKTSGRRQKFEMKEFFGKERGKKEEKSSRIQEEREVYVEEKNLVSKRKRNPRRFGFIDAHFRDELNEIIEQY